MTSAQTRRDAALRRLAKANRWIASAAVVGTGALTEVVAHAFSGHTISKPGTEGTQPQSTSVGRNPQRAASRTRHHRRHLAAGPAPTPVGPAPTRPSAVPAATAPAPVTPAPTAPAPVAAAPAPAPSPAPVVSGGS